MSVNINFLSIGASMNTELISNIVKDLWNLVSSSQANNFGVFIGGIGTVSLSICAWISFVYGLNLFKTWQKQRQFDKRSDIAQEVLNVLDLFKKHLDEWMQFADSWLIFDRENQNELNNYLKRGNSILDELILASSKAARLQDHSMFKQLEELRKKVKLIQGSIAAKHFPDIDSETKNKAIKDITELPKQINVLYQSIHDSLIKINRYL